MKFTNLYLSTSFLYLLLFPIASIAYKVTECFQFKSTEFRIFRINKSPFESSKACELYGAKLAEPNNIELIHLFRNIMGELNMQELIIAAKYCTVPNKNIYYWFGGSQIIDVQLLKPMSYQKCTSCYCISLHRHDPTASTALNPYVEYQDREKGSVGYICERNVSDFNSCSIATKNLQNNEEEKFVKTMKSSDVWSTFKPKFSLETTKNNNNNNNNNNRVLKDLSLHSYVKTDKQFSKDVEKFSTPRQKREDKKEYHRPIGSADSQKLPPGILEKWDLRTKGNNNSQIVTTEEFSSKQNGGSPYDNQRPPKMTFVEANEILNKLNDSLTRDLDDEKSLTSSQLQEVAFRFLREILPNNIAKPPPEYWDGPISDQPQQSTYEKEVKEYALNFMGVTSLLLDGTNANAWTEVTSRTRSGKDKISPTNLLEQMDAVIDCSAKYFELNKLNETTIIFESDQLEVKVQSLSMSNQSIVVQDTNNGYNTLERKIRDVSQGMEGVYTVVSATYKTVPHLMNAILVEENKQFKNATGKGRSTEHCYGFPVSESLCNAMNVNSSKREGKEPELVWVFPDMSNVLSITVFNETNKESLPVLFDIHLSSDVIASEYSQATPARFKDHRCVFYDVQSEMWSDYGCQATRLDKNKATCNCNHTTSFALILLVPVSRSGRGKVPSDRDLLLTSLFYESVNGEGEMCGVALQLISYVTGGLSVAFLTASFIFFAFARRSSDRTEERNTIHMCLAISMLLLHVILLVDEPHVQNLPLDSANRTIITDVDPGWICYTLAAFTHCLLLCNFSWMTLEGILLYLCVVTGDLRHKTLGKWKHVVGWLFPVIITSIAIAFGFSVEDSYINIFLLKRNPPTSLNPGDDVYGYICYLSRDLSWFAFVPVAVSLAINIFIMIRVMVVIARLTRESRFYKPSSETLTNCQVNRKAIRKSFIAFCKLYPVLGITWLIALIAPFVPKEIFCYMEITHTAVNGVQGVFFFLVTVVQNVENRSLISATWHRLSHDTRSLVDSLRSRKLSSHNVVVLTATKTIPHSFSPPNG